MKNLNEKTEEKKGIENSETDESGKGDLNFCEAWVKDFDAVNKYSGPTRRIDNDPLYGSDY